MRSSPLHKHAGGCHCGNIRIVVELATTPQETPLRACNCSFCRAHGVRTVSDPNGAFKIWAQDWSEVIRYRFGTRTADFLLCQRCGVYVGAVSETPAGLRGVANVNTLTDHMLFPLLPTAMDYGDELQEARVARRAANWMPAVMHTNNVRLTFSCSL
jgi:hypothetical protein